MAEEIVDYEKEIEKLKQENRALRACVEAFDERLAQAYRHGQFCHAALTCLLEARGQDMFLDSLAGKLIEATACDEVALLYVDGSSHRWNRNGAIGSEHPCGRPCPLVCLGKIEGDEDIQEFHDLHHDSRIEVPPECPSKSALACRIRLNGKFWGVLSLHFMDRRRVFSDTDRKIIVSATYVVAMCVYGEMRIRFHESEVLLRSQAIEKTPLSIYIKDADNDFRYVEINEFTCKRLGMTREQFIGHNDVELFTPEIAAPYLEVDRKAMESDGVTKFRQSYVDKFGVLRPVASARYPVTMPDGRRLLVCYSVEISEFLAKQREVEDLQRRTAEERDRAVLAEETNAFVARLLKNATLFSEEDSQHFVLAEVGKFAGADRSYIYFFKDPGRTGMSANVCEWCAEGVPSEIDGQQACDMGEFPEAFDVIMAGKDISIADVEQMPPRSRSWLTAQGIRSLIATPIKDQQGAIIGFVGFDFVRRKIENFDWRIVHVLHEAADIISICRGRSQFYFAMRAAERAQADFFASVSHDIRTPLNSIIGFSELLKDECDPRVRNDYLERISFSGSTLLALVNDVLDLSRIDAGALSFCYVPVDFPRLLKLIASTFDTALGEKNVKLALEVGDMPLLMLDENRTRQVFFNLIGNAVKYTDSGKITVSGWFACDDDGYGMLQVSVADTGIGIAPENVSKLMRPYVRIQNSTESRGGTGLGLSISKRIVEACGGNISIKSVLGKGATFTVTLPRVEWRKGAKAACGERKPHSPDPYDLSGLGVLVVDDLEMNRRVLCANCQKLGVRNVFEAESGQAALDRIDDAIDLVLCDMKMPGMDGIEFIRALRERSEFTGVPVVLVTADVSARNYGIEQGAAGVLLKPVVQEEILQVLLSTAHGHV